MADAIPAFRPDGYLPEGIHKCTEADLRPRFGSQNRRRRRLAVRIGNWLKLGKAVHARRLLIDGSFVTAKEEPDDVHAVILLPSDFKRQVDQGIEAALELEQMFLTRQPEEIFAAEDETDFGSWCEFFSRTRGTDGRRKGLLEIAL